MTAESQRLKKNERLMTEWNAAHPVGTRVRYWSFVREGEGKLSVTRSQAWLVSGHACVLVKGKAGGIALTHVESVVIACAYCEKVAEGHYSVHRDGFGVGPEVELCDACGGKREPTLSSIWTKIAQPSDNPWAWNKKAS